MVDISINTLADVNAYYNMIDKKIEEGEAKSNIILDDDTLSLSDVVPEDMPCKLCEYSSKIKNISSTIDEYKSCTEIMQSIDIQSIFKKDRTNLSEKDIYNIKNRSELLSLKLKKSTLNIKIKLVKIKRRLLLLAAEGKIAPILQTIFNAIIFAIQLIFKVIAEIINILEKIIALIPFLFKLDAEGMAFFLTPKSFKCTPMRILNANQSCERVLPTSIITAIDNICNVPLHTMAENKKVAMMNSMSESAANAFNENIDSNIITYDADINYISRELIISSVNTILAVLPFIEPLPKYERLPIWKNLGFLLWLATGWNMAGRASFGLPGV